MQFAPRLDPSVVDAVHRMPVDSMSIADAWRRAGALAVELGLCRPSYHAVLHLVVDERKRRAERREDAREAVDDLWAYTGIDYARVARRMAETRRT